MNRWQLIISLVPISELIDHLLDPDDQSSDFTDVSIKYLCSHTKNFTKSNIAKVFLYYVNSLSIRQLTPRHLLVSSHRYSLQFRLQPISAREKCYIDIQSAIFVFFSLSLSLSLSRWYISERSGVSIHSIRNSIWFHINALRRSLSDQLLGKFLRQTSLYPHQSADSIRAEVCLTSMRVSVLILQHLLLIYVGLNYSEPCVSSWSCLCFYYWTLLIYLMRLTHLSVRTGKVWAHEQSFVLYYVTSNSFIGKERKLLTLVITSPWKARERATERICTILPPDKKCHFYNDRIFSLWLRRYLVECGTMMRWCGMGEIICYLFCF